VKETLEAINRMQADGIIGKYAIGGAVGATHYLEPAATLDVDIFVVLPAAGSGLLISLAPIYEYLKTRGGVVKHEHLVIGGWPVQFLPPSDPLEIEAVEKALQAEVEDVSTWVMSAEHLAAIALKTGRAKDYIRMLQFIDQDAVDIAKLEALLERHALTARWRQFKMKYMEGLHG
jgi:hypothetical protein